jgi:hypothetical protein
MGGGELRPTRPRSICYELDEEKGQGGAPGESREDMRDRGTRGSPWAMNFAGDARRWAGLRWRILSSLLRLVRRGKERRGRGCWGLL